MKYLGLKSATICWGWRQDWLPVSHRPPGRHLQGAWSWTKDGARHGVRRKVLGAAAVRATVVSEGKWLTEPSGMRNGSRFATRTGLWNLGLPTFPGTSPQQEVLGPLLGWADTLASRPLVRGALGSAVWKQRSQNFWDTLQVYGDHQIEALKSDAFPESLSWKLRASARCRQRALPSSGLPGSQGREGPWCAGPASRPPSRVQVSQPLIRPLSWVCVTLLKGSGEAGGCPGRSHRNDQSSGNKGQCSTLKGLEPCLLEKARESLNHPTHKTHLSVAVFHPWLSPKGPTGSHPESPGWSCSHNARSFLLGASHDCDLTSLWLPSSASPAPAEARHRSHTACLSSGWDLSSVSLMTLQTVFNGKCPFWSLYRGTLIWHCMAWSLWMAANEESLLGDGRHWAVTRVVVDNASSAVWHTSPAPCQRNAGAHGWTCAPPPRSYVAVLAPRTSDCDCVWRQGLYFI